MTGGELPLHELGSPKKLDPGFRVLRILGSWTGRTVISHNYNLQNFKMRVSNSTSKYVHIKICPTIVLGQEM